MRVDATGRWTLICLSRRLLTNEITQVKLRPAASIIIKLYPRLRLHTSILIYTPSPKRNKLGYKKYPE